MGPSASVQFADLKQEGDLVKIRMKTHLAGSRNGERWPQAGETKDLPEDEALDLIKAGLAEPVKSDPERRPAKKAESRKV